MPGFGKSGTCRIRSFNSCMNASSQGRSAADCKPLQPPRRHVVVDPHIVYLRPLGPAPQMRLEPLHRFAITLSKDLNGAVRTVDHPAVNAFLGGRAFREEPEADALHPAPQHESLRHE